MALTIPQLQQLWINAGGSPKDAVVMANIAQRESRGNPAAQNLNAGTGDHSIGLWQINQLAWKGQFGSDQQLKDPLANAKAAVAVMKRQGPTAWSTYNPAVDAKYIGQLPKGVAPSTPGGGAAMSKAAAPAPGGVSRDALMQFVLAGGTDNASAVQGLAAGLQNAPTTTARPKAIRPAAAPSVGTGGVKMLPVGGVAGGFLPKGATYSPGRADQGRDGSTSPGGAIVAPGAGKVLKIGSDPNGFGPRYPIVQFSSGPYAGRTIYLGHTLAALPAGASFQPGTVLSHTGTQGVGNATTPGWFEIGFAPGDSPGKWGQPTPFR
jgi:hypothetical protein